MFYFRINSILLIGILFLGVSTHLLPAKGIEFFQGSWKEASLLAIKLNKPIFVEAYSDDCGLCKQIEEHTFNQEEVGNFYNDNFINLKINIDKKEGLYFRNKYNVQILPDLLFLDPMGQPIYRDLGDKDKAQLLALAHKVIKKPFSSSQPVVLANYRKTIPKTSLETMKEQYEKGFKNIHFLYDYAYELKKHNEPYSEIVNNYIAQLKKDKLKNTENLLFIYDFSNDLQTNAMDMLLKNRAIFEAKYGYAHIVNRIKSSAISNAYAAAKKQDDYLFKEAKHLIKKSKLPDEERMLFLVESYFYKEIANWEQYILVVKNYIQKHNVRNALFLQQKAHDVLTYSEKPNHLGLAKEWIETALIQSRNYTSYDTYAHILFKLGHLIKAESVAQKALEYAKPENRYGLSAKSLIDDIRNYTSTTTSFNRPIKL